MLLSASRFPSLAIRFSPKVLLVSVLAQHFLTSFALRTLTFTPARLLSPKLVKITVLETSFEEALFVFEVLKPEDCLHSVFTNLPLKCPTQVSKLAADFFRVHFPTVGKVH